MIKLHTIKIIIEECNENKWLTDNLYKIIYKINENNICIYRVELYLYKYYTF